LRGRQGGLDCRCKKKGAKLKQSATYRSAQKKAQSRKVTSGGKTWRSEGGGERKCGGLIGGAVSRGEEKPLSMSNKLWTGENASPRQGDVINQS